MKINRSRLVQLVESSIRKNLLKEEEIGNVSDITRSVTNSKGGKVKIPDGYAKFIASQNLTASKGDPYEYIALINLSTKELAYMPIMDDEGGVNPKKNVGRVFDKGSGLAYDKLHKRYQENSDKLEKYEKAKEDAIKKTEEFFKGMPEKVESGIMKQHISNIILGASLYAGIGGASNIITGKSQDDAEFLEVLVVDSAEAIKTGDPFYRKAIFNKINSLAKTNSQSNTAKEFLNTLGLDDPSDSELAKSEMYKKAKEEIGNPFETDSEETRSVGSEKEESNESRQINERRIRAIIRHELLRARKRK